MNADIIEILNKWLELNSSCPNGASNCADGNISHGDSWFLVGNYCG